MSAGRCAYLKHAVRVMESIASTKLAGKWDNVGLLIDSLAHHEAGKPYTVFFTNDLTPKVVDEALAARARLIVTYHPTPFAPMKQFRAENTAARILLECARAEVAVFSPHTSLDVVAGGLNDWLVDGVVERLPGTALASRAPAKRADDPEAAATGAGDGRIATLATPTTVAAVIDAVKGMLGLAHVQVALPSALLETTSKGAASVAAGCAALPVRSFAVCAGSGASVLAGAKADVFITGEMSHHEVLAANHAGVTVILTNHSNCERGFLPVLASRFEAAWARLATAGSADAAAVTSPPGTPSAGAATAAAATAVAAAPAVGTGDLVTVVSSIDADPLVTL